MIKSESFVIIQGWMVTDLKLKGLDLLIFAIIYSYSQDCESSFTGSLALLQEWTNASNLGVRKSLDSLQTQGLIHKDVYTKKGVRRCSYCYSPIGVAKKRSAI